MIDKTEREKQAVRDARHGFAEALQRLGLLEPFYDRTPQEIDSIIEACVNGYQASLLRQSAEATINDEIPF
jgi:hypothetical protein